MQLEASRVFEENWNSQAKITINRGGSSSTKTWSLLQLFTIKLITEENVLISVVRQTMPALKKSVLKDFNDYLFQTGMRSKFQYNKTDQTFYNPETNSQIEFFSVDDEQKARGPRREYLWVNEANEIKWDIFRQLLIRTRKQAYIDFNPSDPNIWINKELELVRLPEKGDVKVIKSNYLDNPFLAQHEIEEIKNLQPSYNERGDLVSGDPNFWKIFGLGEYGSISGLIFKQPRIITKQEYDEVFIKEGYGLDFGYSNSYTALTGVKYDKDNKRLYLDEKIYERGLDPDELEELMRIEIGDNNGEIIADYAEAEQIALYQRRGWNMIRCTAKDVKARIGLMKRLDIFVTESSDNVIKEFGLYKWKEDKNGNTINEPVKMYDHAMDGIGYRVVWEETDQYGSFSGGYFKN